MTYSEALRQKRGALYQSEKGRVKLLIDIFSTYDIMRPANVASSHVEFRTPLEEIKCWNQLKMRSRSVIKQFIPHTA